MAKPSKTAKEVAQEINRVAKDSPALVASFNSDQALKDTITDIIAHDTEFEQRGGIFFRTGETSSDTAQKFTDIHVKQYRQGGRPSLPALAMEHARKMGLDKNSSGYKAMISIATRTEMALGVSPAYHNQYHFADVTAVTANLIETNDAMVKKGDPDAIEFSANDKGLLTAVAIGHDMDHCGKGNPKGKHYFNEEKSFNKMRPLLEDAGFSPDDIRRAEIIIKITSPDGPHAILKKVAKANRDGVSVDWDKIDPDGKFSDLKPLADDPKLTQMAGMLSDADLYASGGAGMEANRVMSKALSKEVGMDFNSNASRKFFLDNIVGEEGFASNAGRKVANETNTAMRIETEERLKTEPAKKPSPPKGV